MTGEELIAKWTAESDSMRRRGVLVTGAALCDEFLHDVASLLEAEAETLLTLKEASDRSGYGEEHLGRLIREGKLPNGGRKGAPRLRVRDLPRRPRGNRQPARPGTYNVSTDARALLDRLDSKGRHQR
jgi:hypothetical protein